VHPINLKGQRLRLLVAIASYGEKNLPFLRQVIQTYYGMDFDVRVVVFSNCPKDLDTEVDVVVGLPTKNPWSLPFAHKEFFRKHVENYDLFAYSEDDIEVTEQNIRAFLRATTVLGPREIPGFLHTEQDRAGRTWMVCVHRHFHWVPESTASRGDHVVAEFTNEHSAFYLLTQKQLKLAIASGGFLREPHEGRYDLLCTAATDPYTSCGFKKVICISHLREFLIRHLPNKYIAELCVDLDGFEAQVSTLMAINAGRHPARSLFDVRPKFWHSWWQKHYYEPVQKDILEILPWQDKTVLSIGCGWGMTEASLIALGAKVTALPLDSVIGEVARRVGVEVINGTWNEAVQRLGDRSFDCILMTDLLHLLKEAEPVLCKCAALVAEGGVLVLTGPNFCRFPWLMKRTLGLGPFKNLSSFNQSGISVVPPSRWRNILRRSGFDHVSLKWCGGGSGSNDEVGLQLGGITAKSWRLLAFRSHCTRGLAPASSC